MGHRLILLLVLGVWVLLPGLLAQAKAEAGRPGIESSSALVSLNGNWDFRFDPEGRGEREQWGPSEGRAAAGPWDKIRVPGTYNIEFKDKLWYQGKAWYRRTFAAPQKKRTDDRVVLHFGRVGLRARVWLNGHDLGEHLYAYSAFSFDVTDKLRGGENVLVVEADNEILARAIPDKKWDGWWFYGGIDRDVMLEVRPALAIVAARMDTRLPGAGERHLGDWICQFELGVKNVSPTTASVGVHYWLIDEAEGKTVAEELFVATLGPDQPLSDPVRYIRFAYPRGVQPWTPERPKLYRLKVALERGAETLSTYAVRTAFRDIRTEKGRILLNGQPIRLRGINRHEEWFPSGSAVPRERTRQDLEDIRRLGCNMVRSAHYQQDPSFYDLCDELGLLVWTEIPAWKTAAETLSDEQVYEIYGQGQLREMIDQLRRHPSVAFWAVGNEFPSDKPAVRPFVEKACKFVKLYDPYRLVTFASDRREKDVCFAPIDVISVNEYYGWYYGSLHDVGAMLDRLHQMHPDKPILVSEFGAGTPRGYHKNKPFHHAGKLYCEDYQAKFLQAHLEQIFDPKRKDYVAGGVLWVYQDFRDPHRTGGGQPEEWDRVNLKGVVNPARKKKKSYSVVREFFKEVAEGKHEKVLNKD